MGYFGEYEGENNGEYDNIVVACVIIVFTTVIYRLLLP